MSEENVGLDNGDGQPQRSDSVAVRTDLPGKLLAARRQELNWSIEDVAHTLHLAPRQVQAIETDNFGALPGIAITRGFIRSYAKLLKLDPAPLLQMVPNESESKVADASLRRALPAKPFYANRSPSLGNSSRSWLRTAIAAIVLIVLAAVLFIAWKSDWLEAEWITEAQKLFAAQTTADKAEEVRSGSELSQTQVAAATSAVEGNDSGMSKGNVGDSAVVSQAVNTPSPQSTAPAGNSPAQLADTPEQKEMLVLKLREDSWIEIRNSRNKVILSRLAKAGESEAIPINEPLKLIVGNATGVDAQLRGVPVELAESAKNNVARLTVN